MEIVFKQFPEDVQKVISDNAECRKALHRLEVGSDPTPRSWFYENKEPQWILGSVSSALNGMKDLRNIADWDLSKSDKFGPQGGSAPLKERLDSFNEYFVHISAPKIVHDPIWIRAKQLAIRRLKFNEAGRPTTLQAVVDRGIAEKKYNTNSEFPLYLKRRNPIAVKEAIRDAPHAIEQRFPSTLGTRASMGKTGVKARNIFMASMAVNIYGQRYQQVLQDYIRSLHQSFFLPWEGWEHVQAEISDKWDKGLKFGADYTKMDQHFNLHHGLEVLDVIKHYFRKEYWSDLESTIRYVFTLPILTNLGYVDQEHAMPSGSEWTNFLETRWNYIFTIYLELKYHLKFVTKMGIGDDQLYILAGFDGSSKGISWITKTIVSEFEYAGLPGNPEKQEVSREETGFLQRHCSSNWNGLHGDMRAAGVYSLIRNVTSQVYPEFYHNEKTWDHNMFARRTIMIAENACQHPLFKWYVQDFLAKANDNILEFVRQDDSEIKSQEEQAKTIANFIPTYNQEKQTKSLLEFETLKLLREVA
nr:MAG: RNA-dependent RNA polymerase [Porcine picobirnavirus]